MSYDVLIIGAGIVGAACAAELAAAGMQVGIVERDCVGSGATAAGMGHLVVMDGSPAEFELTRYSQQLWDALIADQPQQHEYARSGTLWVAADAEELAAVDAKHSFYHRHGIGSEILDAAALYAAEPNLRPGLAGGLLIPSDGVVYPPRSALALIERARQHGATLISGTVSALQDDGVVLADGGRLHAAAVLIANGSACVELAPELPIRAKKGHLAITERYPGFVRHQLVELGYIKNAHASDGDSVAFNVQPRPTGQILIGSSRQFDCADRQVDRPLLRQMLRRAAEYLPAIADLSCVRVWTGIRAASPDGLPLIGPHPWRRNAWLAVGHEGLGITTALGTAKILAAQLLNRDCAIPIAPYLATRSFAEVLHG
jgi:glycine/D-amino acid oxidase-like deaminating enzyme